MLAISGKVLVSLATLRRLDIKDRLFGKTIYIKKTPKALYAFQCLIHTMALTCFLVMISPAVTVRIWCPCQYSSVARSDGIVQKWFVPQYRI